MANCTCDCTDPWASIPGGNGLMLNEQSATVLLISVVLLGFNITAVVEIAHKRQKWGWHCPCLNVADCSLWGSLILVVSACGLFSATTALLYYYRVDAIQNPRLSVTDRFLDGQVCFYVAIICLGSSVILQSFAGSPNEDNEDDTSSTSTTGGICTDTVKLLVLVVLVLVLVVLIEALAILTLAMKDVPNS